MSCVWSLLDDFFLTRRVPLPHSFVHLDHSAHIMLHGSLAQGNLLIDLPAHPFGLVP